VAKGKKKKKAGKVAKRLKALSDNPLVADVVAAALVGAASALKDTKAAQRLAASAGDELEKLSKKSAQRGNAMWQLALEIGRSALDEVVGEFKAPKAPKVPKAPKAPKRAAARKRAGSASAKRPRKSKRTTSSPKK
jgi:hypothetical protein